MPVVELAPNKDYIKDQLARFERAVEEKKKVDPHRLLNETGPGDRARFFVCQYPQCCLYILDPVLIIGWEPWFDPSG